VPAEPNPVHSKAATPHRLADQANAKRAVRQAFGKQFTGRHSLG
jgi:hypothetical protein